MTKKALRGQEFIKTILAKGDYKALINDLERLHNEYHHSLKRCEQDIKVTKELQKNSQLKDNSELQQFINKKEYYQREASLKLDMILYANEKTIEELEKLMPIEYKQLITELMEKKDYKQLTPIIELYESIEQSL